MKKKILSMLLAVTMAFSAVITGYAAQETETESHVSDGEITVTDLAGREVTLAGNVEKVVVTFNFEEYFAVAGEEGLDKLVGWSRNYWDGRRPYLWNLFAEKYPQIEEITDVGYISKDTFDAETVIACDPDVVIVALNDIDSCADAVSVIEEAGIPVVYIDYHLEILENILQSTEILGKILGQEERASQLCDYYTTNYNLVTDRLAEANIDRSEWPTIYMENTNAEDGPATIGNSWGTRMWGGLMETSCGNNIARELLGETYESVDAETVLSEDPDVIILTGTYASETALNVTVGYGATEERAKATLEGYFTGDHARAGWSELSAYQNKRVGGIYQDISRHVYDVAGLQFIAKMLYPDLFEDIDPQATLQEFNDNFYLVDLDGTFFTTLDE